MSAGVIFQEALRVLNHQLLPEVSRKEIVAALEAGFPGPLPFLYDAGAEAGLPRQTLLSRASAIHFVFSAINLCDDLTDDECHYLPDPHRSGPCTELILQTLAFSQLAATNLPGAVLSRAARDLVIAGGAQHIEMRTQQWTADEYREVADGIAGRQWSAYLQILWCDTAFASRAAPIGMNVGLATLIWEDISSNDPRYTTLSEADKQIVLGWAVTATQALRKANLRCLDAMLRGVRTVFKNYLPYTEQQAEVLNAI